MSQLLIQTYLRQLDIIRTVSGSRSETIVREAFKDLLKAWARPLGLTFIAEYPLITPQKNRISVDGAVLHELRLPLGHWEAKDVDDDLDAEISKKLARGYPADNLLFTDDRVAVLFQQGQEVARCEMMAPAVLEPLLNRFFHYERAEIAEFRKSVVQFKLDLPDVLVALRELIDDHAAHHAEFQTAAQAFLIQAQAVINPELTAADVREMLIQHILTEDIFAQVFNDSDFHRHNNVAQALYALEAVFFTGALKKQTLKGLAPYYAAIKAAAARLASHNEKQTFLKVIYENFYRVYNPKAADRLGVVYTPNEIVRFMIAGADWLCARHFGRYLIDQDVDILDPATGTGTFICELLEYFRGQPAKLAHKYQYELHANEVAILPYYVANLNIEATYAGITGQYADFPSLCFVDTLENVGAHTQANKETGDLFGAVSAENKARIQRQNTRRISVVIGNPPYNANQRNTNDNNRNRDYPNVDVRIRNTYAAAGKGGAKNKLYDMYTRFFRWASDRLNKDGIIAFITNRSFIDSRTFDGFRQIIAAEFAELRIVDLGGDVRANPKLSGTKHNVFGIQTGVAILFLIKNSQRQSQSARIFYSRRPELETAEEKLRFLGSHSLSELEYEDVRPDKRHNWLHLTDNDFETLIPLASKETKAAKNPIHQQAIFKLYSLGVATNRDDWVYDFNPQFLEHKIRFLIDTYNADRMELAKKAAQQDTSDLLNYQIKWTYGVKKCLSKNVSMNYDAAQITVANYRPFVRRFLYRDRLLNESGCQTPRIFGYPCQFINPSITVMGDSTGKPYFTLAIDRIPDLNFVSPASGGTQTFPLYLFNENGQQFDNITDWALAQFTAHYAELNDATTTRAIDKTAIFHYCYAVLHDPIYRDQYALNLKRDFPRIPFYPDFWQWVHWGAALLDLHLNYETVTPFPLTRIDQPDERARTAGIVPKVILRADVNSGTIQLDSETQLRDIPAAAWTYQLGNRCAIDWILDQYKEKTPKDPTIRAQFNTYCFADYKEQVVDLIARVTTVSIETMQIVNAMRELPPR